MMKLKIYAHIFSRLLILLIAVCILVPMFFLYTFFLLTEQYINFFFALVADTKQLADNYNAQLTKP